MEKGDIVVRTEGKHNGMDIGHLDIVESSNNGTTRLVYYVGSHINDNLKKVTLGPGTKLKHKNSKTIYTLQNIEDARVLVTETTELFYIWQFILVEDSSNIEGLKAGDVVEKINGYHGDMKEGCLDVVSPRNINIGKIKLTVFEPQQAKNLKKITIVPGDKLVRVKNISYDLPIGEIVTVKSIDKLDILLEETHGTYQLPNFKLDHSNVGPKNQTFKVGDKVVGLCEKERPYTITFKGNGYGVVMEVQEQSYMYIRWYDAAQNVCGTRIRVEQKCFQLKKETVPTEYKVGDRIRIRTDLKDNNFYGRNNTTPEMVECRGKETTITTLLEEFPIKEFHIDLDNGMWRWTPEMFDRVIKEPQKQDAHEVRQMEKPTTKLEKDGLKKAKKDAIEAAITAKAVSYAHEMTVYIELETTARNYRKDADAKAELLGITEEEKKNLL